MPCYYTIMKEGIRFLGFITLCLGLTMHGMDYAVISSDL